MQHTLKLLPLFFLLSFASNGYANCSPKQLNELTIEVIEQENGDWAQTVKVLESNQTKRNILYTFEFLRLGGGGCKSLITLPDYKLFAIHWDEGAAGTSSIYSREMLYLWKVNKKTILPVGQWILKEEDDGIVLTDRTYRFTNGHLTFEGQESLNLEDLQEND